MTRFKGPEPTGRPFHPNGSSGPDSPWSETPRDSGPGTTPTMTCSSPGGGGDGTAGGMTRYLNSRRVYAD